MTQAAEICQRFSLRENLRSLLDDGPSSLRFLDRLLVDERQLPDAVDFLAHALPPRECVGWGCLCVELLQGKQWTPAEETAMAAAVDWMREPSENGRLAAREPAARTVCDHPPGMPAGHLAAAVWASTGIPLPPWDGIADAPAGFTPKHVALAVQLAILRHDGPEELLAGYQRCVALAIGTMRGKHLWFGDVSQKRR